MPRPTNHPDASDSPLDSIDLARRLLRAGYQGTLQFDEHFVPLKYVIDPASGALVAPVMVAMLAASETILFVPEETASALQILVSLEPLDDSCATADRWRIHHGEPDDVRWATLFLDMAKLAGVVIDGDALMTPNPLAGAEPALCKHANQKPEALRAAVVHRAGIEIESPICVGVDTQGIDIRAKFDIVRLWFDEPATDEAAARAALDRLLDEASP